MLHALLAVAAFAAADALSKKVSPVAAPPPVQTTTSCDALPGTWTGYIAGKPLYDSYQLAFRGGAYPAGSFDSVYVGGGNGWTLGIGQLSADNTTAVITFDTSGTLHGNVSDGCTTIVWDNGSSWRKTSVLPKRVHLVSMNHLDVGYNGIPEVGLVNNILSRYFSLYFPRALAMAQALRDLNYTERFVYTTHAWLVDLYLHCPSNFTLSGIVLACPSPADVQAMRDGIARGDIVFHASPFNIQFGGAHSQDMLEAIFAQPVRLAQELGLTPPVVASLRDVPGAPRSLVAGLSKAGIQVLSIGINSYAPRPQIPTPCVWKEPNTNTSVVLIMTDQGVGYPLNPGTSPTDPGGLASNVCVSHPDSSAVLCWAFRTDNSGPPESVSEMLGYFDIARWQWPGAEVVGSTFEAWWDEFQTAVPSLPVVTQEQGETWLTGFASDPYKMAFYRAASREYSACVAAGQCHYTTDPRIQAFLLYLMKMPEHTWGLPSIYDNANYTNAAFHAARAAGEATYVQSEQSWTEQRVFGTQYALEALADHPLADAIKAAAAELVPVLPNPAGNGYSQVTASGQAMAVGLPGGGSVSLAVDPTTGALAGLTLADGTVAADPSHPLARLVYQTVNDTDTDAQHITVDNGLGCCCCYGWDSMQKQANPVSSRTTASLVSLWASQPGPSYTAPVTFLARLSLPALLNQQYGAPGDMWLNYTVGPDGSIAIEAQLFNKTATRLGEAIYLDFDVAPSGKASQVWLADVLGLWTDPLDVVERGSQRQHGVGAGVAYVDTATGSGIAVDSWDVTVFSPWTAVNETSTMIVPFYPLQGPVLGFSAVLFANIYNTNFALYSIDPAFKYRFVVRPMPPSEGVARAATAAAQVALRVNREAAERAEAVAEQQ